MMSFHFSFDLVAFRGLWDKYAPPCTIAAYIRAAQRGVSFLVDPKKVGIPLDQIIDSVGSSTRQLPFFVIVDRPANTNDIVSNCSGVDSLLFIERCEVPPFYVYTIDGGRFNRFGLYFPLNTLTGKNYPEKELREARIVLYESIDTILDLGEKKLFGRIDDNDISKCLATLSGHDTVLLKVSDLVERELLLRGHVRR